jgi:acyl-CoA thioesterase I
MHIRHRTSSLILIFVLLYFSRITAYAQAHPANYLQNIVEEMNRQWPRNRTITIVCHGHSVPAGYFKTPVVDTFNAYPQLLHKKLKEQFPFAVLNVIVTAIGGENSEPGAARFVEDVLSLKPDIITIDYALNDRGIGLEKAQTAWQSMINQAQTAGAKIILFTPTADKREDLNNPDSPLSKHAEQIRKLAQSNNVGLVDSYAIFKAYVNNGGQLEKLMSQINHPSRRGHELVVNDLFKWFELPCYEDY